MADDELAAAAAKAFRSAFDGVIRLEPEGGSPLWIDGRKAPPVIAAAAPAGIEPGRSECVWRAARETLIRLLDGERLLSSSYLSGRLAIAGDMAVMARLQLERPRIKEPGRA